MSQETIVTILCALLGSGLATTFVTAVFKRRDDKRRVETGESQGMRWLLQDRLEHLAQAYIAKGSVTYEELKNWNKGHHIYHDLLGGNGDLNVLKSVLHDMCKQ